METSVAVLPTVLGHSLPRLVFLMCLGCFLRRSGAPPCLMSFDLASADDGPDNFQPDCLHGQM